MAEQGSFQKEFRMNLKKLSFSEKNQKSGGALPTTRTPLDSLWFQKAFLISFCLCGSFLIAGNVLKDKLFPSSQSLNLKEKNSSSTYTADFENVVFPPFPVNLKTASGIATALVKIELQTNKLSAKREILLKNKKFQKHLLLLLSGQNTRELNKNKTYFEEKIRSQFNIFLSQGTVKKVKIHTALIN